MANQPIYGQPRKREKVGSGINRKKLNKLESKIEKIEKNKFLSQCDD